MRKPAVRRSGMKIPEALGDSIPEYMTISLKDANGNPKRALYKSELMMLEMLAQRQLGTPDLYGNHRRQRKPPRHG